MVFGQKAYDNIMPWLRTHYSQKFLIQNVLLCHPQNIQWRYLLVHARNYIETFRAIMALLGVDIPPLEGVVQLRFLITKKRTLDMMECVEGFANSEVLEAVHQRTDNVKMARTAKVEEMMKALNPKEAANAAKRVEKEAEVAVAAAAAAAALAAKAKVEEMKEAEVAAKKRKAEVAALAAKAALAVAGAVLAFEAAARWKVIQEARRKVIQDVEPAAVPPAVSNDPFIRFQLRSQLHN
jgi:hypothetical protein